MLYFEYLSNSHIINIMLNRIFVKKKTFIIISTICFMLATLSMILPYESHDESTFFGPPTIDEITETVGLEILIAYGQFVFLFGISLFIFVSRKFLASLLALLLSVFYLIYIVILGIIVDFIGLFSNNQLEIGFYLAAFVSCLFFTNVLVHFIKVIRWRKYENRLNNPNLLDINS